jgi:hypothetical protein
MTSRQQSGQGITARKAAIAKDQSVVHTRPTLANNVVDRTGSLRRPSSRALVMSFRPPDDLLATQGRRSQRVPHPAISC